MKIYVKKHLVICSNEEINYYAMIIFGRDSHSVNTNLISIK